VSDSLQYFTAYEGGGTTLSTKAQKFRFVSRTHATDEELPPAGIRVWWRDIWSDNGSGLFVCRRTTFVSGEDRYTIQPIPSAGEEAEPDTLYRNQCSWTLWRHATEDSWAIRSPKGKSTEDGGLMVTAIHSTANEAYRIRVDGAYLSGAPFFRFKSEVAAQ
jgi:hypothetical protein